MDLSVASGQIRPGQLTLSTEGACRFDLRHLLAVFTRQRSRFAAVLADFTPEDWTASTRCADWSAHDVVRHLCDCNAILASADRRVLDVAAGFDPRTSPRRWPAILASESPDATLARFADTTRDLLTLARSQLDRGEQYQVMLPYGSMDWAVLILHGFWDSWLHERDILLAQGREYEADAEGTAYATAYGVFLAAAVAAMFGRPVPDQQLTLSGNGGGVFDLHTSQAVTLTLTPATVTGPPAAQVTDALGGRAPGRDVLSYLPAGTRTALCRMADFFNTPAPPPKPARAEPGHAGER
jgi:uncharacterized protein (TIGR03083 family)